MDIIKHKEIEDIDILKFNNIVKIGTIIKLKIKVEKRGHSNNKFAVISNFSIYSNGSAVYSVITLDKNFYPEGGFGWIDRDEFEVVSNDIEYGVKLIEYYLKYLEECNETIR